ncbi:MAG: DsbA family protein [Acidimicrobiia bacterium]|nr:DsbA family protein [Acidimicrobiia bacterium]
MRIDFHFDPTCPWCWITSRWLVDVRTRRDLDIRWRPFSLKIKNEGRETPERFRAAEDLGLGSLRVTVALAEAHGGEAVGALYTELGRRIHHDRQADVDLGGALAAAGLDPALASTAGDETLDGAIRGSMKAVLEITGDDVGVPIVEFDSPRGRRAFFGPIVSPAPVGTEADALFDHVIGLASIDSFFELKRSRSGSPQLGSRP